MDGKFKGHEYFWVPLLKYIFHIIMLPQNVVVGLIPRI
jgi:hypothetical protein